MSAGKLAILVIAGALAFSGIGAALADWRQADAGPPIQLAADVDARKNDGVDDEGRAIENEDDGDGDATRGDDGTSGGNNTGDGDATRGNDGTNGGNNTGDGDWTGGNDGTSGGDNTGGGGGGGGGGTTGGGDT